MGDVIVIQDGVGHHAKSVRRALVVVATTVFAGMASVSATWVMEATTAHCHWNVHALAIHAGFVFTGNASVSQDSTVRTVECRCLVQTCVLFMESARTPNAIVILVGRVRIAHRKCLV